MRRLLTSLLRRDDRMIEIVLHPGKPLLRSLHEHLETSRLLLLGRELVTGHGHRLIWHDLTFDDLPIGIRTIG
ncbi:hypothetical protein CSQ87_07520 [Bifidobacterium simiarum]|uniref:Uncharacterized protein n=1 Tax=Bifidobacterium simiarum TaxID=2045441 RepID=A0A2M9HE13_9BIFI|nr:hypothetical protein CSQ87_07520 [Bifidobacterium simiarum]